MAPGRRCWPRNGVSQNRPFRSSPARQTAGSWWRFAAPRGICWRNCRAGWPPAQSDEEFMSERTLTDPKVIDGKAFAAKLREKIARQVKALQSEHGFTPGLAVVLVGEDPASKVYVRNKGEQTVHAGMASFEDRLPATTTQADLLALIDKLNKDPNVN